MAEPDSFGLDPVSTLAHVGSTVPASRHRAFWRLWREMVASCAPRFRDATLEDADAREPGVTHVFESARHVRIGCRLVEPPDGTPARACVVTTHGYAPGRTLRDQGEAWLPIAERGVAVVVVRVRGYPGSTMDTGALWEGDYGWITHGLPREEVEPGAMLDWVYPLAVADVVNACRAARVMWSVPLWLHGESLGGGLAVSAAAQAASPWARWRGPTGERADGCPGVVGPPIERLVLGLPTMGDWAWRRRVTMGRPEALAGSARDLARYMADSDADREAVYETLRLADSVVHARRVLAPSLCKLALRDEVVPAPSAAAVFNALRADPGRKWRFVVPAGHADAGLRNARRHALFDRMTVEFLDPARRPERVAAAWEDRLVSGERAPGGDAAPAPASLFGDGDEGDGGSEPEPGALDAGLLGDYEAQGRTLDDLAYTREFEAIVSRAHERGDARTEREILHRLMNLRKAGRLPRVGRGATPPTRIDPAHEQRLRDLIVEEAGAIGVRDQLPYSPAFDRIAERFNAETGHALDRHAIWRLIARIAK